MSDIMCRMDYRRRDMESLVSHGIRWEWHTACGNCGCESNWHAFDLPEGATMVALPERFPCKGFEFAGCPHNCEQFVFLPPMVTVTAPTAYWEALKEKARAKLGAAGTAVTE